MSIVLCNGYTITAAQPPNNHCIVIGCTIITPIQTMGGETDTVENKGEKKKNDEKEIMG